MLVDHKIEWEEDEKVQHLASLGQRDIDVNMLGSFMKSWIESYVMGSLIVTV